METRWGRGGRGVGGIAVLVLVSLGGCGTRVATEHGAAPPPSQRGDSAAVSVPGPTLDASTGMTSDVTVAPQQPAVARAPQQPAVAKADQQPALAAAEKNPALAGGVGRPEASDKASADRGVGAAKRPAQPIAPVVPVGHSPVVVASVGTFSGPAGVAFIPVAQGAQIWAKGVNAKGGLNGHPVRMVVLDDGGDPARHRALLQQAIEQERAIAFLALGNAITASKGSVDYINSTGVPVVGGDTGSTLMYSSPMFFPQASAGEALVFTFLASAADRAIPAGMKELGTVMCVEASACGAGDEMYARRASGMGFEHVYRARVSLAQPDYTASCLAARNAGAKVLIVLLDTTSLRRFAASCARQAYRPLIVPPGNVIADDMKDDPNLEGTLGPLNVFPWFQTGTAATDEFQQAMRAFAPNLPRAAGHPVGWTAGKLLERAGTRFSEPPTSRDILQGLWSIKDDSLGGITQPLTFVEGQPAKPMACWFNMVVERKGLTTPDGFQRHCVPYE